MAALLLNGSGGARSESFTFRLGVQTRGCENNNTLDYYSLENNSLYSSIFFEVERMAESGRKV